MKKKLLSLLMAVIMSLSIIPSTAISAFAAAPEVLVSNEGELQNALNNGNDIKLTADFAVNYVMVPSAYNGVINGDGHTLTAADAKTAMFEDVDYADGPYITLRNITINGNGKERAFYLLNGTLTVDTGTIIQNCTSILTSADGQGGAIYAYGGKLVFNQGATILNNYTPTHSVTTGQPNISVGGAVHALGTRVEVHGATFTGNHCITNAYGSSGGAIWVGDGETMKGASFFMDSGTFNVAAGYNMGGGLYAFLLSGPGGCTITGGTFNLPDIGDACGISGGAIASVGTNTSISNVTFTTGTGTSKTITYGGFIDFVGGGNVNIDRCTFTNNMPDGSALATYGGAICFEEGKTGSVEITNCDFNRCSDDAGGGAISFGGKVGEAGSAVDATIDNCNFTKCMDRQAWGSAGGAVMVEKGNTVTIKNSAIDGGSGGSNSQKGGAIYNNGNLTIENTTIENNRGYINGGAIYNDVNGNMTINGARTTVKNNKINDWSNSGYGAGIYNAGVMTINAGTISGNSKFYTDQNPEKADEYAGTNIYCAADVTIASAVNFDAGDVRVLDQKSSIILKGVPNGNINVSISEKAATGADPKETDFRYVGYLVAKSASSDALNKLTYLSKDADASTDPTALSKWVFLYNNTDNTIRVGQNVKMIYDPNEENFNTPNAAFAAGTTDLQASGDVEKVVPLYTSDPISLTKIAAEPSWTRGKFINWYGTAVTQAQMSATPEPTPFDFSAVRFATNADMLNGKINKLLGEDRYVTVFGGYKRAYTLTYKVTGEAPATFTPAIPAVSSHFAGEDITLIAALTTTERTKGGVPGTWTFSGWTPTPALTGGKMPAADVTVNGSWTFKADPQYTLTYKVTGEAPATFTPAIPAVSSHYAGENITLAAALTTTETTKAGVPGTWTFSGWTAVPELTNGKMPAENVVVNGSWTFRADPQYTLTYRVSGDAPTSFTPAIPAATSHYAGETITIAPALTTTQITKDGVPGTWTFNGWTPAPALVNGKMPAANVVVSGSWTFREADKYTLTYQVTGEAPATFTPAIPASTNHYAGDDITLAAALTTTETKKGSVPGTWTFSGWTAAPALVNGKMPAANVVVSGSWTFREADKYTLTYQVTGEAPATFTPAIPASTNHYAGDDITLAADLTTTETKKGAVPGTWTFSGWTPAPALVNGKMPAANVVVSGSWTFRADPQYTLTYQVTGEAPATFTPAIPAVSSHYAGDDITLAAALTTTETKKGSVPGTWTFSGWTPAPALVNGKMPAANVVVSGSWTFRADPQYTLTYQVTGEAPATFTPAIPASTNHYAGDDITLAAALTTTETKKGSVPGTWTFSGWTAAPSLVNGKMPAANVVVSGSWLFTPDSQYSLTYQVTGEAPATFTPAIPVATNHYAGDDITLAATLTTTETKKGAVPGTWTFSGWTVAPTLVNGKMPAANVVVSGSWTFRADPQYTLTYQVTGEAPATFTPAIPASTNHYAGDDITLAAALTTTETKKGSVPGTWTFSGWTAAPKLVNGKMPAANVVVSGSWTFRADPQYTLTYEVTGEAPATFTPALPAVSDHYAGDDITLAADLTTTETKKGTVPGTWIFNGWTAPALVNGKMPAANVVVSGSWTFRADPQYTLTYNVTGEAPATFTPAIPAVSDHYAGDDITLAADLTTTETKKGTVPGTWIFNGWTAPALVNGKMPAANVVANGSWTFRADPQYTLTYEVTGEAPATFTPALPAVSNHYAGDDITLAAGLKTIEKKKGNVPGTWTFSGWTATPALENGKMPAANVVVSGSWKFTAFKPVIVPPTGDNSNPALWLALAAIGIGGVAGVTLYSRKRRNKAE